MGHMTISTLLCIRNISRRCTPTAKEVTGEIVEYCKNERRISWQDKFIFAVPSVARALYLSKTKAMLLYASHALL
jgi:hypothetical protein